MFKCDKQKSLQVVREILQHLKEDKTADSDAGAYKYMCVNECMDPAGQNTNMARCIDFKHKLSYIELVPGIRSEDHDEEDEEDEEDEIVPEHVDLIDVLSGEVHQTHKVVLYDESKITDQDEIKLMAYLHDSSAECDISYPNFTYNEKHNCWIIMDSFWGPEKGTVNILSFDAYPECKSNTSI